MGNTMYSETLQCHLTAFEAALPSYMPRTDGLQATVAEAMTYACTDGGKRIRPLLVMEFCRLCGGDAVCDGC